MASRGITSKQVAAALFFSLFYPAGLFPFSGEPASPRGGSDTWRLPSERQQVAAAAAVAAERSSLPKIRQRGRSGDGASRRHTAERRRRRTLPRRWKLLSTASRGAFQFCWRNKQRFEATPRVEVSPCLKTTGAGYYYVTQCCFCLFRFVQPVFRLFIHARLFCFAFGLVKKKKIPASTRLSQSSSPTSPAVGLV